MKKHIRIIVILAAISALLVGGGAVNAAEGSEPWFVSDVNNQISSDDSSSDDSGGDDYDSTFSSDDNDSVYSSDDYDSNYSSDDYDSYSSDIQSIPDSSSSEPPPSSSYEEPSSDDYEDTYVSEFDENASISTISGDSEGGYDSESNTEAAMVGGLDSGEGTGMAGTEKNIANYDTEFKVAIIISLFLVLACIYTLVAVNYKEYKKRHNKKIPDKRYKQASAHRK